MNNYKYKYKGWFCGKIVQSSSCSQRCFGEWEGLQTKQLFSKHCIMGKHTTKWWREFTRIYDWLKHNCCILYILHTWWVQYSGVEGKLLSKHPRISLIVLSMPVSGRTLSLEVNGVRILLKAQYFNSFYLPSTFTAVWRSGCPEWFGSLMTRSL